PPSATATLSSLSVNLTASVDGNPDGKYKFYWTTTGEHGTLHRYQQDQPPPFVTHTPEAQVFYVASANNSINARLDTVTVQVFEDDGTDDVGAGYEAIGSATSTINGQFLTRTRIVAGSAKAESFDDVGPGFKSVGFYVKVPKQSDAISYSVRIYGYSDPC